MQVCRHSSISRGSRQADSEAEVTGLLLWRGIAEVGGRAEGRAGGGGGYRCSHLQVEGAPRGTAQQGLDALQGAAGLAQRVDGAPPHVYQLPNQLLRRPARRPMQAPLAQAEVPGEALAGHQALPTPSGHNHTLMGVSLLVGTDLTSRGLPGASPCSMLRLRKLWASMLGAGTAGSCTAGSVRGGCDKLVLRFRAPQDLSLRAGRHRRWGLQWALLPLSSSSSSSASPPAPAAAAASASCAARSRLCLTARGRLTLPERSTTQPSQRRTATSGSIPISVRRKERHGRVHPRAEARSCIWFLQRRTAGRSSAAEWRGTGNGARQQRRQRRRRLTSASRGILGLQLGDGEVHLPRAVLLTLLLYLLYPAAAWDTAMISGSQHQRAGDQPLLAHLAARRWSSRALQQASQDCGPCLEAGRFWRVSAGFVSRGRTRK